MAEDEAESWTSEEEDEEEEDYLLEVGEEAQTMLEQAPWTDGEDEEDALPITVGRLMALLAGVATGDLNETEAAGVETFREALLLMRRLSRQSESNEGMVQLLVSTGRLRKACVAEAFLKTDRAVFLHGFASASEARAQAYCDLPIRHAPLHQSAPSVYGSALEALDLRRGQSFLNIGSGSGYLSALAARELGPKAHHVGVEIRAELVRGARQVFQRADFWPEQRDALRKNVTFLHADAFALDPEHSFKFDRIYVGAGAKPDARFLFRLLAPGGVLVGPFQTTPQDDGQSLITVTARGGNCYSVVDHERHVNFSWLIDPPVDDRGGSSSGSGSGPTTAAGGNDARHLTDSHRRENDDDADTIPGVMDSTWQPRRPRRVRLPGPIWSLHDPTQFSASFRDAVEFVRALVDRNAFPRDLPWLDVWSKHVFPCLPADSFPDLRHADVACAVCAATPPNKTAHFAKCLDCRTFYCSQACQTTGFLDHRRVCPRRRALPRSIR